MTTGAHVETPAPTIVSVYLERDDVDVKSRCQGERLEVIGIGRQDGVAVGGKEDYGCIDDVGLAGTRQQLTRTST